MIGAPPGVIDAAMTFATLIVARAALSLEQVSREFR